jgi:hypothetical protein
MASMPSNSEETRDFLITIDNSKNTMIQIQNQDFLFRPFVYEVKKKEGVRKHCAPRFYVPLRMVRILLKSFTVYPLNGYYESLANVLNMVGYPFVCKLLSVILITP